MKLSRSDVGALAVIVASGALGVALFGARMSGGETVTVDVTTDISEWTTQSAVSVDGEAAVIIKKKKVIREDGTEEIVVTVEGDHEAGEAMERRIRVEASADGALHLEEVEGEHFEWRSESGTEEHVFITKSGERIDASTDEEMSSDRPRRRTRTRAVRAEGPEPIVFIDGERVERSAIDELGPDLIDRIEVIKGEAAQELFGPEAANGVIQIFTKEGAGS